MLPADVIVASVFLLLSITVEWLNALLLHLQVECLEHKWGNGTYPLKHQSCHVKGL